MTPPRGRTLFWRLSLALMGVQAVVAVVLGVFATAKFGEFHLDQTRQELERLTPFACERVALGVEAGGPEALGAIAEAFRRQTGLRLTVIRPDGVVRADSHRDPALMENHRYRREIDAALRNGAGWDVRESLTLGIWMLYVARHVEAEPVGSLVIRTAIPITAIRAERRSMLQLVGIAAILSFGITLSVIYLVTRRLANTVAGLADGAARFAAGDLRHRIRRPPGRELGALAIALNNMARRLSQQIAQLQTQRAEQRAILQSMTNGVIALDLEQRVLSINEAAGRMLGLNAVDPRGRLLQALVREPALNRFVAAAIEAGHGTSEELTLQDGTKIATVSEPLRDVEARRVGVVVLIDDVTQLRRLESMRSDFAANVSHELRTPITSIKGYVETMEEIGWSDETQARRFIEIVRRNADRLEAIVEDLLSLARLEQTDAREKLALRPVFLRDLVENVTRQAEHLIERNQITLRCDVGADLEVLAQPSLLEQAIGNLVSNALNYSGAGTTVSIAARTVPPEDDEPAMVEIRVEDEGPGIAPEHLPRLFERFYRVDQARSRQLGGTGLGLAIVKHIAIVHGGWTEVESRVGHGSTFRITLPAG